MSDVCVPVITKRGSPLTGRTSPFSRRDSPLSGRARPFTVREVIFGPFCVNIYTAIFQDGFFYRFQNDDQLIYNG